MLAYLFVTQRRKPVSILIYFLDIVSVFRRFIHEKLSHVFFTLKVCSYEFHEFIHSQIFFLKHALLYSRQGICYIGDSCYGDGRIPVICSSALQYFSLNVYKRQISLIEKAGGSYAFGEWIASKAKTRKSSLMCTWFLGVVVFIDDYLNSLTVGSCMTTLTDKHKVPREFLSYVVDSTAAPLCVVIPISTWAVFCSRILESLSLIHI